MTDYDAQPDRCASPEPQLSSTQLEADDSDLHAGLMLDDVKYNTGIPDSKFDLSLASK